MSVEISGIHSGGYGHSKSKALQPSQQKAQVNPHAIYDPQEVETIRSRFEHSDGFERLSTPEQSQKAIHAYQATQQAEERQQFTQALGVDVYA